MREIFEGVFKEKGRLYTKSKDGFRLWDPSKSKPAAAIKKGLKIFPLKKGLTVLYLGAAHGVTSNYFSDIVGKEGIIFAVEISDKVIPSLLEIAEDKKNICPILSDARFPEEYGWIGKVDFIYQDISQRDQVEIFLRNVKFFLKQNCFAAIAIKARAIDSVAEPSSIYRESLEKIGNELKIEDYVELDPFEKDHCFIVCRK